MQNSLTFSLHAVIKNFKTFTLNFVDNIYIISRNEEEHLEHWKMLLQALLENNFTLKFEKTNFFQQKLDFVGLILTPERIRPQKK